MLPKILGVILLVAAVPLSVALLASSIVLTNREEANAKRNLANISDLSSAEVQRWLFIGRLELSSLAASSPTNRKEFPAELKEEVFRVLKQNFRIFTDAYILELDGRVQASDPRPPPIANWRELEVFQIAARGEPSLSETVYTQETKEASYIFAVPIIEGGKQWGVLAATIVNSLQDQFSAGLQTKGNRSFIIEGNGLIIGDSNRAMLGQKWTAGEKLYMGDFEKTLWLTEKWLRLSEQRDPA